MQEYSNITISNAMSKINKTFFLPDIQRSYVWKPDQIYALYDSLMREYPISTFLFWEQTAEVIEELTPRLKFIELSGEKNNIAVDDKNREYTLVLDGQQRLTSFYLTLHGHYKINKKKKNLYFNILSGIEEDEWGNRYEFIFKDSDDEKIIVENNKCWVQLKSIYKYIDMVELSDMKSDIESKFQIHNDDFKKIYRLYKAISVDRLINYYPEREADMDKVLDIFIRTNSGGTKLSKSDLLFSNIKRNWRDARNNFIELLNTINQADRYKFTHDMILKTCLVLFSETQNDIKYNVSNSKKVTKELEEKWESITRAIKLIVDELKTKFLLKSHKVISSHNALIPLIYFVYKNNLKSIDNNNSLLMQRWLIKILLNGIFSGQSDTMLYLSKQAIAKNNTAIFPYKDLIESIKTTKKSFDTIDNILGRSKLKYNSTDSYLILSLLYSDIDFNAVSEGNLPQQDHIIPQSLLKESNIPREKIDSIYNIQFLDAYLNKKKSDGDSWINNLTNEERKKYLIPSGQWEATNFDQFLEFRKLLMVTKLKKLI
jgi:uncharacterized protein with ParB-like and HNH nuclease domain